VREGTSSQDGRRLGQLNTLPTGNGLVNMRQRVKAIGGSFQVISKEGLGTTVQVSVPLLTNSEQL